MDFWHDPLSDVFPALTVLRRASPRVHNLRATTHRPVNLAVAVRALWLEVLRELPTGQPFLEVLPRGIWNQLSHHLSKRTVATNLAQKCYVLSDVDRVSYEYV